MSGVFFSFFFRTKCENVSIIPNVFSFIKSYFSNANHVPKIVQCNIKSSTLPIFKTNYYHQHKKANEKAVSPMKFKTCHTEVSIFTLVFTFKSVDIESLMLKLKGEQTEKMVEESFLSARIH